MPIDTNLNQAPFYDDFDETKNYHRVLFRPAVPVQARELTQLQTILQNQIERFGDHIFVEGTIVKGCSFTLDPNYYYAKVLDKTKGEGLDINLAAYANGILMDTLTGLTAVVVDSTSGLQTSSTGDFNTLYFKYLNVGTNNESQFSNNSTLTVYTSTYGLQRVDVTAIGSGYQNGDLVSFSGATGTGATGHVVVYPNTSIKQIILDSPGTGYTSAPTATITSNTGVNASLSVRNYIDQISVPSDSFSASVGTPVGRGFAFRVSDGVIYQKGAFVRVDPSSVIVSKYDTVPTNVVVGFQTNESVVTNYVDPSLVDNAAGTSNAKAPGAYRLQLTPQLVAMSSAAAQSNTQFFTLIEFENGQPVRQRQTAAYSELNNELAKRTFDESGDYVVTKFNVTTEDNAANTAQLNAVVSSGLGYVQGFRVQLTDTIRVPFDRASAYDTVTNVNITTNYGNYVFVNELKGSFAIATPTRVNLRDTAGTNVSSAALYDVAPSLPGNIIGSAVVKGVIYSSGTIGTASAQYQMFLYDVQMQPGQVFDSVKSITVDGVGIADVVLEPSASLGRAIAVLKDSAFNTGIFQTGVSASKSASTPTYAFNASANVTFAANGYGILVPGGGTSLPYSSGSFLNSAQKLDVHIIPQTTVLSANKSGTVTVTGGNNVVTGVSGTAFLTDYAEGDYIVVNGAHNQIVKINDNASMITANTWAVGAVANVHAGAYPKSIPIPVARSKVTMGMEASGLGINIGQLASTVTAQLFYKARSSGIKYKSFARDAFVKIKAADLAANPQGPWSLGLPDVLRITGVYKTSSNSVYDQAVDVTSAFVLDNGQRDTHYSIASIARAPGSSLSLNSSTNLVIKLDTFYPSDASPGYYTVDSYPKSNTASNTAVYWYELPTYSSATVGQIDLRDAIDTRAMADATVPVSTSLASAGEANQSATTTYSKPALFPVVNETLTVSVDRFLPRRDVVAIDTRGSVSVIEGHPSINPSLPLVPSGSLALANINVPPFPTISSASTNKGLAKYTTSVSSVQNKRYTMKDIEGLDSKISQLQYYSLLSSLEKDTQSINLPSESNTAIERFKNGFLVDSFMNYNLVDLTSAEYKASIDVNKAQATPTFEQNVVNLKVASSSGATVTNNVATLQFDTNTSRALISQPIATRYRNPVEAMWSFKGTAYINPSYDNFVSTTSSPAVIDMTAWQSSLINSLNNVFQYMPINMTSTSSTATDVTSSSWWWAGDNILADTVGYKSTTTTSSQWQQAQLASSSSSTSIPVGNFIRDVNVNPYMKGRPVAVYIVGLRPGARHYMFFDTQAANQWIAPAIVSPTHVAGQPIGVTDLVVTGAVGSPVYADANGVVAAVFYLPDNVFFIGERELVTIDVADYASRDTSTSSASAKYNAFNMTTSQTNLTLSSQTTGSALINKSNTSVQTSTWSATYLYNTDPLAQSFLVSTDTARQNEGLMLTGLDLFFKQKDASLGVVVEVRTVELGVPTKTVVVSKRMDPSLIYVSDIAAVATRVIFDVPVMLKSNNEYAVVIIPEANSPNYLVWTGEAGMPDVLDPTLVKNQDWNQGAMFVSTNASTWTPFQKEDIKFTLYFADFTTQTGIVQLVNDDSEYLTLSDVNGVFITGEPVAARSSNYISQSFTGLANNTLTAAGTISASIAAGDKLLLVYDGGTITNLTGTVSATATTTLTGSGTSFTTQVAANDYVVIGNNDLRRVVSVSSNTSMVLDAAITCTAATFHKVAPAYDVVDVLSVPTTTSVVVNKFIGRSVSSTNRVFACKTIGGVVGYTNPVSAELYVYASNASAGNVLTAGSVLIGSQSGAKATVATVNDVGMSKFDLLINTTVVPGTSISSTASLLTAANSTITVPCAFNSAAIPTADVKVRSRSNEIVYAGGNKSLGISINLMSGSTSTTPIISVSPASVLRYKYLIGSAAQANYPYGLTIGGTVTTLVSNNVVGTSNNFTTSTTPTVSAGDVVRIIYPASYDQKVVVSANSSALVLDSNTTVANAAATIVKVLALDGETTAYGNAAAKYISKQIVLADGQEAEDLKLFVSAYRPLGTNIEAYAKIINETDQERMSDKDWTLLTEVVAPVYSSSGNSSDFRDYQFSFPSEPVSATFTPRVTTYSNTTVSTGSSDFRVVYPVVRSKDVLVFEDVVGGSYNVRTVASANSTAIVLSSPLSFSATGVICKKVTQPSGAFKNYESTGNGVVRYFNKALGAYDGYKNVALKIVMTSDSYQVVPILSSVRAIACSV